MILGEMRELGDDSARNTPYYCISQGAGNNPGDLYRKIV
jgi:hypothetical protein